MPGHGAFPPLLFPAGFKQAEAEVFAGADKVIAGIYKQPPAQVPGGHGWGWLSCILGWDCTEMGLRRLLLALPAQVHWSSNIFLINIIPLLGGCFGNRPPYT